MKTIKFLSWILITITFCQLANSQDNDKLPSDTSMYGNNKKHGSYSHIRGFNMYYEIYGVGDPVLIIHGNGASISSFLYQIPYFDKHYKVILADSRSQGKSIDDSDSLSYEMMTDDLNALLNTLRIDSCMVIGWSDGGINGLLLAIRHPEKVKKLAITGANLWPDTSAVDPSVYNIVVNYIDSLKKLPQSLDLKHSLKLLHLLIDEPHIGLEQLHKIQCPTLVIGGDHDVILTKHTLLIAESIPKSYLWILPNSGHSTPLVYKNQFNQVIYEFFKNSYRSISGVQRFN